MVSALEREFESLKTQTVFAQAGDVEQFVASLDEAVASQGAVESGVEGNRQDELRLLRRCAPSAGGAYDEDSATMLTLPTRAIEQRELRRRKLREESRHRFALAFNPAAAGVMCLRHRPNGLPGIRVGRDRVANRRFPSGLMEAGTSTLTLCGRLGAGIQTPLEGAANPC